MFRRVCFVICLVFCIIFCCCMFFFFFQAEDGIRDGRVTGVQTCALPISIMDYIFRWLQLRFLTGQQQMLFDNLRPRLAGASGQLPEAGDLGRTAGEPALPTTNDQRPRTPSGSVHAADALAQMIDMGDAPSCHVCGSIMVRNGSCYKCMSCGSTSGCS